MLYESIYMTQDVYYFLFDKVLCVMFVILLGQAPSFFSSYLLCFSVLYISGVCSVHIHEYFVHFVHLCFLGRSNDIVDRSTD